MKKENQKILTPLVSLDTPGKATVEVVILADPVSAHYNIIKCNEMKLVSVQKMLTGQCLFQDAHEICFVGDEAFRQLSMVDPKGNELLDKVGVAPISPSLH